MPKPGAMRLGRFGSGEMWDEVVLTVRPGPPPNWLEIQAHGGRINVDWMLELLEQHGATRCRWNEFLRQTEPRWRAFAAEQLADAGTERTAAILLDQWNGAFDNALAEIRTLLQAGDIAAARAQLQQLLDLARFGEHLTKPWRVAIIGPPNVGKSSLINALAGFQRSIVAPLPGTTRDLVTVAAAFEGWAVELIDTAGLHAAAAGLEQAGTKLARSAIESSDLCIWVFDASSASPVWPEPDIAAKRPLWVVNKTDLAPAWKIDDVPDAVHVSAQTRSGIAGLGARISQRLVPAAPAAGTAVPFCSACVEYLRQLVALVETGDRSLAVELLG